MVLSANIYDLLNEDYAQRADVDFVSYLYFDRQPHRTFLTTWQWAQ